MSLIEDKLKIAQEKKHLADYYFDNYMKYYRLKKYSKASEFLWGTINNVVYAIGIFYDEKISTYNKLKSFLKHLAIEKNDDEILKNLIAAERIHANFFHNFMDEDMFEEDKIKTLKLIDKLSKILDEIIQEFF